MLKKIFGLDVVYTLTDTFTSSISSNDESKDEVFDDELIVGSEESDRDSLEKV